MSDTPANPAERGEGLEVVRRLLDRLHTTGIAYCHWKSNDHVREGMLGITDLDVLADRGASDRLALILAEQGYKRFTGPPGGDYPGVEDWLAMDATTGRLVHLHLYFRLAVGERYLKGYQLPWEDRVLATRRLEERFGIHIADPALDALLLTVRAALKFRPRDRLRSLLGASCLQGAQLKEFRWLVERGGRERAAALARELLGDGAALHFDHLAGGDLSGRRLAAFRRAAREVLHGCRLYGTWDALRRRLGRAALRLLSHAGRRLPRLAAPRGRLVPRGGVVVAVLGADGSGKSTLVGSLHTWLGWKVDTRRIYFGSGDGPASLPRWPLLAILRVARRAGFLGHGAGSGATGDPASRVPPRGAIAPARAVWALVLAREKRRTLERVWRARARGMVVLCDRYPQNQIPGCNDGPLLSVWKDHPSRLLRALAAREARAYRHASDRPPDLLLRLDVSPEMARRRKPDMSLEEVRRRVAAVASLRFPKRTELVVIDANREAADVLLTAQERIWKAL